MRNFYVLLATAFFLVACGNKNIELNGVVAGANYGKITISNAANEVIYQADINDGKFSMKEQPLRQKGFYKLVVSVAGSSSQKNDIYLEPGATYTINLNADDLKAYPKIVSTSKSQTELSAYHDLLAAAKKSAREQVMQLDSQMRKLDNDVLTFEERNTHLQQLRNQQLDANVVDMVAVFDAFIKKHADSGIVPYLMLNTEYQLNPVGYYEAFKKLNDDVKKSGEGELLEATLKQLIGLAAGGEAPDIEGATPDGKSVDIRGLNKKVVIIDFWRALNSQSERDHKEMIEKLLPRYKDKGLEVVSISLDDNRDKWLAHVARAQMTWPQVSDLKGDSSPNAKNWSITKIPTYYLLDGNGRIIKRCVDYYELEVAVNDYMIKN